jgi:hypothetical protein
MAMEAVVVWRKWSGRRRATTEMKAALAPQG